MLCLSVPRGSNNELNRQFLGHMLLISLEGSWCMMFIMGPPHLLFFVKMNVALRAEH
jgi:hypothetical protein